MATLAERVIARREERGWNPSQLARRVGVSVQKIQQLEAGTTKNPGYLLELAEALDCDPYWLKFGRYGKKAIDATHLKKCYTILDQIIHQEDLHLTEDERHQIVADGYASSSGKKDTEIERDILRLVVRMKAKSPASSEPAE